MAGCPLAHGRAPDPSPLQHLPACQAAQMPQMTHGVVRKGQGAPVSRTPSPQKSVGGSATKAMCVEWGRGGGRGAARHTLEQKKMEGGGPSRVQTPPLRPPPPPHPPPPPLPMRVEA